MKHLKFALFNNAPNEENAKNDEVSNDVAAPVENTGQNVGQLADKEDAE